MNSSVRQSPGFRKEKTYATQVPNSNLDRHPRASLITARKVVRQPRNISGEAGVNRTCDEEHARVHHARLLLRVGANAHGEAHDHNAQESDDERASLAHPVRDPRKDDGQDGSRHVDRHRQELRRAGGVAQVVDDCGKEEADAV